MSNNGPGGGGDDGKSEDDVQGGGGWPAIAAAASWVAISNCLRTKKKKKQFDYFKLCTKYKQEDYGHKIIDFSSELGEILVPMNRDYRQVV